MTGLQPCTEDGIDSDVAIDCMQGRAQKFQKGGAQFLVSVSTENIGEDEKKSFTVPLTGDIYQFIFHRGGGEPQPPPAYAPAVR